MSGLGRHHNQDTAQKSGEEWAADMESQSGRFKALKPAPLQFHFSQDNKGFNSLVAGEGLQRPSVNGEEWAAKTVEAQMSGRFSTLTSSEIPDSIGQQGFNLSPVN